jgi:hypothetical protein
MIKNIQFIMQKRDRVIFGILITLLILISGCTTANKVKGSASQCPSSLQSCGKGCIPQNAICCDNGEIDGYCLQPTTGCGNGACNNCPAGKVFCGMECIEPGKQCCIGDSCESSPSAGASQPKAYSLDTQYNGKYFGTFNYQYTKCDGSLERYDGSFSFSMTLKTRTVGNYVYLDVTKAWTSEPSFGLGTESVTPLPLTSQWTPMPGNTCGSMAALPLNIPASLDIDANHKIDICFPSGKTMSIYNIYVSNTNPETGLTGLIWLSNYPSESIQTWQTNAFNDLMSNANNPNAPWCNFEPGQWRMTKMD